jgi:hypothetical protein
MSLRYCIATLVALCATCYGVELPGFVPVDKALLNGTQLSLKEVDATISAPNADYVWLFKPGARPAYAAINEKSNEPLLIHLQAGLRLPPGKETEFINGVLKWGADR